MKRNNNKVILYKRKKKIQVADVKNLNSRYKISIALSDNRGKTRLTKVKKKRIKKTTDEQIKKKNKTNIIKMKMLFLP